MRVKVEQRHIDRGSPSDPEYCPIALAIQEELHRSSVRVLPGYGYIPLGERGQLYYTFKLPEQAKQFIRAFDNEGLVEPFEFDTYGGSIVDYRSQP